MKYLVSGTNGPGPKSPEETVVVLEQGILPTFEALMKLEKEGVILGGGLPVGDRALIFIIDAKTNDEVDKILRLLPAWPVLTWKVTALQSFDGRHAIDTDLLKEAKKLVG